MLPVRFDPAAAVAGVFTVLAFATGEAGARGVPALDTAGADALQAFSAALTDLSRTWRNRSCATARA